MTEPTKPKLLRVAEDEFTLVNGCEHLSLLARMEEWEDETRIYLVLLDRHWYADEDRRAKMVFRLDEGDASFLADFLNAASGGFRQFMLAEVPPLTSPHSVESPFERARYVDEVIDRHEENLGQDDGSHANARREYREQEDSGDVPA